MGMKEKIEELLFSRREDFDIRIVIYAPHWENDKNDERH